MPEWLAAATRSSPWDQLQVVVAGAGVSGFAAADALLHLGARVTVVDRAQDGATLERATVLEVLGADLRIGPAADRELSLGVDLVVTSPGWRPEAGLLVDAAAAGVPVWGEVELAWRLRPEDRTTQWLCVTGTNGKTTTVAMLAAMLAASGARSTAAGNIGLPLVDAVMAEQPYDVLAVELSSFQLHWVSTVGAAAAAVLNVAPDHLDWHGSLAAYAADKGRVYERARVACIYNIEDPVTEELVRAADVQEGCRAVGFTLGVPPVGAVGVVDDVLVDRAFIPERATSAAELATLADLRSPAPHNVANALAAAALARSHGVSPAAVRAGLRSVEPGEHRNTVVAELDRVSYVDDSKATNPHAAAASLLAYESVVWLAGGLAKGATFDDLVGRASTHLRGVVAFGADGPAIAAAVRRHAPDVPVVEVATADTGLVGVEAMTHVLAAAELLARPGDTVLLAPACASMDQFRDYGDRGDTFARLVRARVGA